MYLYISTGLVFWTIFMTENLYNFVSDIHALGASVLAIASLFAGLEDKWLFMWSTTYFMVDMVELVVQMRYTFIIHHSLAILIPVFAINDPVLTLGTNSGPKIMLIELSTLFLNYWQRDRRNFPKYLLLVIAYFCNRILYLGHFAYFSYLNDVTTFYGLVTLYIIRVLHFLMCIWFWKLLLKCPRVFNRWHYGLHTDFNNINI